MDDLIFFAGDRPVGVIVPSTVFSYQDGQVLINGPAGISRASQGDELGLHRALVDAGALVAGQPHEVSQVLDLLANPDTSRTVSYLLCSARQCDDVISDIATLRRSRVMVVGCGGIGSSICMLLAGAGVRQFLLIDADVIERSNLNRQVFWTLADVGQKKVDVLKRALEARFDGVDVICLERSAQLDELRELAAENVQGVAITADNPPSLARNGWKISKACGVPVVAGGYLHHLSASFHFLPDDCQQIEAAARLAESEQWSALPSAIMPSYGPMNFSLASILSANLIASLAMRTFGQQKTTVARWDSRGFNYSGEGD